MERVIVCGSRKWTDRARISDRLFDLSLEMENLSCTLVHGNAPGADMLCEQVGSQLGFLIEPWDYRQFISASVAPKVAPLARNTHMASLGARLCIAFWDGRSTGTVDMMQKARIFGIPVDEITP